MPGLSDSERRVALWMLGNPEAATRQSMSAIAQANDVSDTTVLRMCRTAGFEGFTDLKLALVREGATGAVVPEIPEPDDDLRAARMVFAANLQAMSDTLAVLDTAAFGAAVDRIGAARHILLGGVGGSALVAQVMYQRCARLGIRCDAPVDSQLQMMHAALLGPDDLAIGISYSGITRDTVLMLEEARARGAATLCITGNPKSPLAARADIALVSVSHELRSEPMAAQVAQISLVDALHAALFARDPVRAQSNEERMVNAILPKSL
jgi:DNA-binding MurR/RpiR family transcriptional regulator